MRVSKAEVFNFLKKSLGIIIKRLEEGGVFSKLSFSDHNFIPELVVDSSGLSIPLAAMMYKIKVVGDAPVYINIDRTVGNEYSVIWPGSYKVIPRAGSTLYLKAPEGFSTRVAIEALR